MAFSFLWKHVPNNRLCGFVNIPGILPFDLRLIDEDSGIEVYPARP